MAFSVHTNFTPCNTQIHSEMGTMKSKTQALCKLKDKLKWEWRRNLKKNLQNIFNFQIHILYTNMTIFTFCTQIGLYSHTVHKYNYFHILYMYVAVFHILYMNIAVFILTLYTTVFHTIHMVVSYILYTNMAFSFFFLYTVHVCLLSITLRPISSQKKAILKNFLNKLSFKMQINCSPIATWK